MLLACHLGLDAVLVQQVYAHVEQLLVVGTLRGRGIKLIMSVYSETYKLIVVHTSSWATALASSTLLRWR